MSEKVVEVSECTFFITHNTCDCCGQYLGNPHKQGCYFLKEEEMEPILQFFNYDHLPANLQEVSRPFHDLAHLITSSLPRNPERTVALRKLLEAKDAAVRSAIYKS